MPTISPGFIKSLEVLDPLLSVRWGDVVGQYVIQRKAAILESELHYLEKRYKRLAAIQQNPHHPQRDKTVATYKGVAEELTSARAGARVIMFTRELSPKTYDLLCLGDIKRYGGYSRYADELEKQEAAEEAKVKQRQADARDTLNRETFDMLNFIWKKKEDALLNGERNMGKLLHGRKSDRPLIEIATT